MTNELPQEQTICHRCGRLVARGTGAFYVVNVEAYADPSPPDIGAETPDEQQRDYAQMLKAAMGQSEQELMDQVYRKFTMHLCRRCYGEWIDSPTG